ncbi:hypothetical protein ABZ770_36015 [Streptomyces sp. NPDC006654]|uniref:hypothetical protein n=1 Tax=Streptomyces sp. NPDC006654 TaxID=3156897 RepID=UPI0033FF517B
MSSEETAARLATVGGVPEGIGQVDGLVPRGVSREELEAGANRIDINRGVDRIDIDTDTDAGTGADRTDTDRGVEGGVWTDAEGLAGRLSGDGLRVPGELPGGVLRDAPGVPREPVVSPGVGVRVVVARLEELARQVGVPAVERSVYEGAVRKAVGKGEWREAARQVAVFRDRILTQDLRGRVEAVQEQVEAGYGRLRELGVDREEWQEAVDAVGRARRLGDPAVLDGALRQYTALIERHVPVEVLTGRDLPVFYHPEVVRLRRELATVQEGHRERLADLERIERWSRGLRESLEDSAREGHDAQREAVLRQRVHTATGVREAAAAERELRELRQEERLRERLERSRAADGDQALQQRIDTLHDDRGDHDHRGDRGDEGEEGLRRRVEEASSEAERVRAVEEWQEYRQMQWLHRWVEALRQGVPAEESQRAFQEAEERAQQAVWRRFAELTAQDTGPVAHWRRQVLEDFGTQDEHVLGRWKQALDEHTREPREEEERQRLARVAQARNDLDVLEAKQAAALHAALRVLRAPTTRPHDHPGDRPGGLTPPGVPPVDAPAGRPREDLPDLPALAREVAQARRRLDEASSLSERLEDLRRQTGAALPRLERNGHLPRITDKALQARRQQHDTGNTGDRQTADQETADLQRRLAALSPSPHRPGAPDGTTDHAAAPDAPADRTHDANTPATPDDETPAPPPAASAPAETTVSPTSTPHHLPPPTTRTAEETAVVQLPPVERRRGPDDEETTGREEALLPAPPSSSGLAELLAASRSTGAQGAERQATDVRESQDASDVWQELTDASIELDRAEAMLKRAEEHTSGRQVPSARARVAAARERYEAADSATAKLERPEHFVRLTEADARTFRGLLGGSPLDRFREPVDDYRSYPVSMNGKAVGRAYFSAREWAVKSQGWAAYDAAGSDVIMQSRPGELFAQPRLAPWGTGATGLYHLTAHSNQAFIAFPDSAGANKLLRGAEAAAVIRRRPSFRALLSRRPDAGLMLVACRTGSFDEGLAQQMADHLGVVVYAPTSFVSMSVTHTHSTGRPYLDATEGVPGEYRTFRPRSEAAATVWFARGSTRLPADQAQQIDSLAGSVARAVLGREVDPKLVPVVTVTGYAEGRFPDSMGISTGRQRAEAVAQAFRQSLTEHLGALQPGPVKQIGPEAVALLSLSRGKDLPREEPATGQDVSDLLRRATITVHIPRPVTSSDAPAPGATREKGDEFASLDEDGQVPRPAAGSGPAERLRGGAPETDDMIRNWQKASSVAGKPRSAALKRIDQAVKQLAGRENDTGRLADVLHAVEAWREDKSENRARWDAVQRLEELVEDKLARAVDAGDTRTGAAGVPGVPRYAGASQLVTDLTASTLVHDVSRVAVTPLGVDLFGLLRPPDVPWFLRSETTGVPFDYSRLTADESVHFLRLMDLRGNVWPRKMDPDSWAVRPGTWSIGHERATRQWAPAPDAPRLASLRVEVPLLVHAIWLGGPLKPTGPSAAFWQRYRRAAEEHDGDATFVLWTDVPRSDVAAVRRLPTAPDDPYLADVWRMADWAGATGIRLVNAAEVFNVSRPALLRESIATETAKQSGPGWAAASDSLRLEVMDAFGGMYSDGDNHITVLQDLYDVGSGRRTEGFAVDVQWRQQAQRLYYQNSVFVAPKGHPFIAAMKERVLLNYTKTQEQLYGTEAYSLKEGTQDALRRRNSVMYRTGPAVTRAVSAALGYDDRRHPPGVRHVETDSDLSWLAPPASAADGSRPSVWPAQKTLDFTQRVVHTLVRDLFNRNGDLHLTRVAQVISRHPEPELVWRAALGYLASREDLRPLVRGATLHTQAYGRSEWLTVPLPSRVQAMLRQQPGVKPPIGDENGVWLQERSSAVRLLPPDAPVHATAPGAGSVQARTGSEYPVVDADLAAQWRDHFDRARRAGARTGGGTPLITSDVGQLLGVSDPAGPAHFGDGADTTGTGPTTGALSTGRDVAGATEGAGTGRADRDTVALGGGRVLPPSRSLRGPVYPLVDTDTRERWASRFAEAGQALAELPPERSVALLRQALGVMDGRHRPPSPLSANLEPDSPAAQYAQLYWDIVHLVAHIIETDAPGSRVTGTEHPAYRLSEQLRREFGTAQTSGLTGGMIGLETEVPPAPVPAEEHRYPAGGSVRTALGGLADLPWHTTDPVPGAFTWFRDPKARAFLREEEIEELEDVLDIRSDATFGDVWDHVRTVHDVLLPLDELHRLHQRYRLRSPARGYEPDLSAKEEGLIDALDAWRGDLEGRERGENRSSALPKGDVKQSIPGEANPVAIGKWLDNLRSVGVRNLSGAMVLALWERGITVEQDEEGRYRLIPDEGQERRLLSRAEEDLIAALDAWRSDPGAGERGEDRGGALPKRDVKQSIPGEADPVAIGRWLSGLRYRGIKNLSVWMIEALRERGLRVEQDDKGRYRLVLDEAQKRLFLSRAERDLIAALDAWRSDPGAGERGEDRGDAIPRADVKQSIAGEADPVAIGRWLSTLRYRGVKGLSSPMVVALWERGITVRQDEEGWYRLIPDESWKRRSLSLVERQMIEALDAWRRDPEGREADGDRSNFLPKRDVKQSIPGEADPVAIGRWLSTLRYRGVKGLSSPMVEALRERGITVGQDEEDRYRLIPGEDHRRQTLSRAERDLIAALDAWRSDPGAGERGEDRSDAFPRVEVKQSVSEGAAPVSIGRWLHNLRYRGVEDLSDPMVVALWERGIRVEEDEQGRWRFIPGEDQKRRLLSRTEEKLLEALDAWRLDPGARERGEDRSNILPSARLRQKIAGEPDPVPIGKWLNALQSRGAKDLSDPMVVALWERGIRVEEDEESRYRFIPDEGQRRKEIFHTEENIIAALHAWRSDPGAVERGEDRSSVLPGRDVKQPISEGATLVAIGKWLDNLRYRGMRNLSDPVIEALRGHGLRIEQDDKGLHRLIPGEHHKRQVLSRAERDLIAALDAWRLDPGARRKGGDHSNALPSARWNQKIADRPDPVPIGKWLDRLQSRGMKDLSVPMVEALRERGITVEEDEEGWHRLVPGEGQRRKQVSYTEQDLIRALDSWRLDPGAVKKGEDRSNSLPKRDVKQPILDGARPVPIGKWLDNLRSRGVRNLSDPMVEALRERGITVERDEKGWYKYKRIPAVGGSGRSAAASHNALPAAEGDLAPPEGGQGTPGRQEASSQGRRKRKNLPAPDSPDARGASGGGGAPGTSGGSSKRSRRDAGASQSVFVHESARFQQYPASGAGWQPVGTGADRFAGLPGGSRDTAADPVVSGRPVGYAFTSAGPRTTGPVLRYVSAGQIPVPAGTGKQGEQWHTLTNARPLTDGDGGGSGTVAFSYEVSSIGRIQLPGGRLLPAGPWAAYGRDFVLLHPDAHLLSGDTAWIGRLDNAEEVRARITEDTTTLYHLTPAPDGLYLAPHPTGDAADAGGATGAGEAVHVPATVTGPAASAVVPATVTIAPAAVETAPPVAVTRLTGEDARGGAARAGELGLVHGDVRDPAAARPLLRPVPVLTTKAGLPRVLAGTPAEVSAEISAKVPAEVAAEAPAVRPADTAPTEGPLRPSVEDEVVGAMRGLYAAARPHDPGTTSESSRARHTAPGDTRELPAHRSTTAPPADHGEQTGTPATGRDGVFGREEDSDGDGDSGLVGEGGARGHQDVLPSSRVSRVPVHPPVDAGVRALREGDFVRARRVLAKLPAERAGGLLDQAAGVMGGRHQPPPVLRAGLEPGSDAARYAELYEDMAHLVADAVRTAGPGLHLDDPAHPARVLSERLRDEFGTRQTSGLPGGAIGVEVELQYRLTGRPGTRRPQYGTVLAQHASGLKIVLDDHQFHMAPDGQVFASVEEAEAAGFGKSQLRSEWQPIPEVVSEPGAALRGETDRLDRATLFGSLRQVRQALAESNRRRRPLGLGEVLGERDGWQVTADGAAAVVHPGTGGPDHPAYTQFTVGTPVTGLVDVLEVAQHQLHTVAPDLVPLLTAGQRFARKIAARFASELAGRPVSEDEVVYLSGLPWVKEVEGFAWLVFSHATAQPMQRRFFRDELVKNMLPVASRNGLSEIRAALGEPVRSFLRTQRQTVVRELVDTAQRTVEGYREFLGVDASDAHDLLDEKVGWSTVGDYLTSALRGSMRNGEEIDQATTVGMMDHALDHFQGHPLALLEMRYVGDGGRLMGPREAERAYEAFARVTQHAFDALPTPGRPQPDAQQVTRAVAMVLDRPEVRNTRDLLERAVDLPSAGPREADGPVLLSSAEARLLGTQLVSPAFGRTPPPGTLARLRSLLDGADALLALPQDDPRLLPDDYAEQLRRSVADARRVLTGLSARPLTQLAAQAGPRGAASSHTTSGGPSHGSGGGRNVPGTPDARRAAPHPEPSGTWRERRPFAGHGRGAGAAEQRGGTPLNTRPFVGTAYTGDAMAKGLHKALEDRRDALARRLGETAAVPGALEEAIGRDQVSQRLSQALETYSVRERSGEGAGVRNTEPAVADPEFGTAPAAEPVTEPSSGDLAARGTGSSARLPAGLRSEVVAAVKHEVDRFGPEAAERAGVNEATVAPFYDALDISHAGRTLDARARTVAQTILAVSFSEADTAAPTALHLPDSGVLDPAYYENLFADSPDMTSAGEQSDHPVGVPAGAGHPVPGSSKDHFDGTGGLPAEWTGESSGAPERSGRAPWTPLWVGGQHDSDPVAAGVGIGGPVGMAGPRQVTGARWVQGVPDVGEKGKGAEQWHIFSRSFDGTGFWYEVSSAGALRLPGGQRTATGHWFRYGDDFVHPTGEDAAILLRADTGWIGEVINWTGARAAWFPGEPHRLTATDTGLYLHPDTAHATDPAGGAGLTTLRLPLTVATPADPGRVREAEHADPTGPQESGEPAGEGGGEPSTPGVEEWDGHGGLPGRVARALRTWWRPAAEEMNLLAGTLLAAGSGARSLVLPEPRQGVSGGLFYAANVRGDIQWYDLAAGVRMQTPPDVAGAVQSVEFDREGTVIDPPEELPDSGKDAQRLPELALGSDLSHVLGLRRDGRSVPSTAGFTPQHPATLPPTCPPPGMS